MTAIIVHEIASSHLFKTHMKRRIQYNKRQASYNLYRIKIGDDYRKGRVNLEKNEFNHTPKILPKDMTNDFHPRSKFIEKRCDSCQEIFLIPHVRGIELHRLVCQMAICPHCNPNAKLCIGCHVPFAIRIHYAKGMCRMCYRFHFQHEQEPE